MRYPFIQQESGRYPVLLLCKAMEVSKSAYYLWKSNLGKVSKAEKRRERLAPLVKEIFWQHGGKIGACMIIAYLARKDYAVSRYLVSRLMREQELVCKIRRRRKLFGSSAGIAPNCFGNKLSGVVLTDINQAWGIDFTYIETAEGWLRLCIVMDLYSRRIIGFSMAEHSRSELVIDALQSVEYRDPAGVIMHSDRGSQFTSYVWREILSRKGMTGSMCGVGNCYDNAIVERFFGTLKDMLVRGEPKISCEEMMRKVRDWIVSYNYARPHSELGCTPVEFEKRLCLNAA